MYCLQQLLLLQVLARTPKENTKCAKSLSPPQRSQRWLSQAPPMRIRIMARDTMEISAGITRMAIRSVIGLLASLRRAPRPSPPRPRPARTTAPEGRSGPIECPAQFGRPRIKSVRGLLFSRAGAFMKVRCPVSAHFGRNERRERLRRNSAFFAIWTCK